MSEPGGRIGQDDRLKAEQVARGTFQPDRRSVHGANRGIAAARAVETQHGDWRIDSVEHCHVHAARLAPETEQHHFTGPTKKDYMEEHV